MNPKLSLAEFTARMSSEMTWQEAVNWRFFIDNLEAFYIQYSPNVAVRLI